MQPAQGQLIAFMIMISRQIYRVARSTSSSPPVVALSNSDFTAAAVLFEHVIEFSILLYWLFLCLHYFVVHIRAKFFNCLCQTEVKNVESHRQGYGVFLLFELF